MNLNINLENLYHNSPLLRRLVLLILDISIIYFSYIFIQTILLPNIFDSGNLNLYIITNLFLGFFIYTKFGQYQSLSSYFQNKIIYQIATRNFFIVLTTFIFSKIFDFNYPNFAYNFLFFWLITSLNIIYRIILKDFLINLKQTKNSNKIRVAIYGAGLAGAQLATSINLKKNYEIITFIDDSPSLWGRSLLGIPIKSVRCLDKEKKNINQILIAIPSINNLERESLMRKIKKYNISHIKEMPSFDDLISGKAKIDNLYDIDIDSLLRRAPVLPNKKIIKNFKNSIVCVTGAGGTIGGELCKQIIKFNAKTLVMIDTSESSLYSIDKEIKKELEFKHKKCEVISILGNCCDKNLIRELIDKYLIEVIFHAAAYKHVPLVEQNPLQGIYNNIFSTKAVCEASLNSSVKKFILVSTDKAVRPTNLMGATKRLAELIVQAYAEKVSPRKNKIKFAMVRFGNVLNSSGSVVPLFKEQINNGGPITVTDPKVIRYFMTISEAAELVIQSSELTEGGEVFLLDMGKPVSIYDLAKQMIRLSGLQLKDKDNPNGDIEIKFVGLRSGEKLFEELLIDSECFETEHNLIYKANEKRMDPDLLFRELEKLDATVKSRNLLFTIEVLNKLVPEWEISETLKKENIIL